MEQKRVLRALSIVFAYLEQCPFEHLDIALALSLYDDDDFIFDFDQEEVCWDEADFDIDCYPESNID